MTKNDFALRPPMGWNSYDYYDTTVTEEDIKRNADYMAENLKAFGWEYIVVDIEWYAIGAGTRRKEYQYIPFSELAMDEFGRFIPDPNRFPSSQGGLGFKPLADYVHSKGLKFGIHIMRGIPRQAAHAHVKTVNGADAAEVANASSFCVWNPDMYGVKNTPDGQAYYDSLLELYAQWGVDFIKCDDICNTNAYPHNPYSGRHEIEMLHKAIMKCGREVVLSLSPGPALIEQSWHYTKHANMWRITDDFWDHWHLLKEMFWRCELWQDHVSEGNFPDCDMLPVGMLGKGFGGEHPTNFTHDEMQTMLTLWSLFGSPLMIGSELPKMDEWTVSLLTNREILAMQDPALRPHQICRDDKKAIWTASSADGIISHDFSDTYGVCSAPFYVAFFNLDDEEQTIELSWDELSESLEARGTDTEGVLPTDYLSLWDNAHVTTDWVDHEGTICVTLPAHGCIALRPAD